MSHIFEQFCAPGPWNGAPLQCGVSRAYRYATDHDTRPIFLHCTRSKKVFDHTPFSGWVKLQQRLKIGTHSESWGWWHESEPERGICCSAGNPAGSSEKIKHQWITHTETGAEIGHLERQQRQRPVNPRNQFWNIEGQSRCAGKHNVSSDGSDGHFTGCIFCTVLFYLGFTIYMLR